MAETTIRTSEPRELLALIPYQLGFQPVESVVLVSLRAPRLRVGLVARVDLIDLIAEGTGPGLAATLVSQLVQDGARRAVLVVYTTAGRERARQARSVMVAAGGRRLGELDCWVVTSSGYYGLDCREAACCPGDGRPLSDLQSTAVGAEMVLKGAQIMDSRDSLARIPAASAVARRSARRAAARWAARGAQADGTAAAHRWRRESLSLWRSQLAAARAWGAGEPMPYGQGERSVEQVPAGASSPVASPTVAGRLQAGLADVLVRDAVLLGFISGAERVADRVIAGDGGSEVGDALRAIVDPAVGVPPEAERVTAARAVLELVASHCAPTSRAPALTLLAVLSWWEGDGARAGAQVDRALVAEPGYRLAVLLGEALAAAMPPGWLRRRGEAGDGARGESRS